MCTSKSAVQMGFLIIAALLLSVPAFAASHYAEDFSDMQAQGWTSATAWSAAAQDYRNSVDGQDETIAVYTGDTWKTDYYYNLRVYSEHGASGNRVGVVFNYIDAKTPYYRVLVNSLGEVTLELVTNHQGQPVSGGVGTVTGVASDTWLNMQVVVRGNTVTARVEGHTAFSNVPVSGLVTSRIGVMSQFNLGRFDNIEIIPMATALFKTGFDGASIGAPYSCATNTCFQNIDGTDPVTGYTWPAKVWSMTGRFQTTTGVPFTPPLSNYILNEIVTAAGPQNTQTPMLHQAIKVPRSTDPTVPFPQDPYYITQATDPNATQGDLYVRYWVKLQPNSGPANLGSWRVLIQWKTGGDFRLNLTSATNGLDSAKCPSQSAAYWRVYADNDANSTDPNWMYENYWEECAPTRAVPTSGQWTKVEFFSHRGTPGGTDGRVWVAINGQQVFNLTGKQMWGVGDSAGNPMKINRIMAPQIYTNASAAQGVPVEQWVDDYEVWDGFPSDASPH